MEKNEYVYIQRYLALSRKDFCLIGFVLEF